VTYLNQLKTDLEVTQTELFETSVDIGEAGSNLYDMPVHSLVTGFDESKALYDHLNTNHLKMAKLLKLFRLQRAEYMKFFETNNLQK
jgi:hypothetical protein